MDATGQKMERGLAQAEQRIVELEQLVSRVRHDVNGALTPALMVADRLRSSADPAVSAAAEKIAASILRATAILKETRGTVPSRGK